MLGEVDAGFRVAMRTLDLFRPSVGAFAVGMAQAALDAAVDHVATRQAFGGPLGRAAGGQPHRSASMATRLEAARLLVYAAAARLRRRAPTAARSPSRPPWPSCSPPRRRRRSSTSACSCTARARCERGHLLEHLYRDVRAPRIYEGASEVQRIDHRPRAVRNERITPDDAGSAPPPR